MEASAISPVGINNSGQIVGISDSGVSSFLYNGGAYTTFNPPPAGSSGIVDAIGINNRGQLLTVYSTGSLPNVAAISGGGVTFLPPGFGVATGFNDTDQVVGGNSNGVLDSGGTLTPIIDPLGVDTTPYGINDAGQIVGYQEGVGGGFHGFLYSGGVFTTIDDPSASAGGHPRNRCEGDK